MTPEAARLPYLQPTLPKANADPAEQSAEKLAPSVAAHVRAGLRNFKSGRAAQDALMTLRYRINGRQDKAADSYLKARGLKPMATATSGTPAAGGYLLPDAVTGAVQLRLMTVGAARRLATVVPVATGAASVPFLEDLPTVYYVDEAAEIPTSTPSLGALGIHPRKRAVLVPVSNELVDDSAFSVLDLFVGSAANALAAVEDDEFINGDGTSTYGGEVGLLASLGAGGIVTAASGHDTWAELDIADFAALVGKLPERYAHPDNAFLCSTPFFAIMAAAAPSLVSYDGQGQPLFMGKRVIISEKMPRTSAASQVSLLFGDFANAVVFADRGIRFETSGDEPNAFVEDLTLFRAVSRYDLTIHNMGTASTAGAVVGLRTAAGS